MGGNGGQPGTSLGPPPEPGLRYPAVVLPADRRRSGSAPGLRVARRGSGRGRAPLWLTAAAACAVVAALVLAQATLGVGDGSEIAPGVSLHHLDDPDVLTPPGPISINALRLDPSAVELSSGLAGGEILGSETVLDMAERTAALAAVNGGFFTSAGNPAGLLKVAGELVSDTSLPRGAVAVSHRSDGRLALSFDRVRASVVLRFHSDGASHTVSIRGVDTTRLLGELMLYTPQYHEHSDTAPTGTEWAVSDGVVIERRVRAGKTPIPRDGFVLSYGGTDLPEGLAALDEGTPVRLRTEFVADASGHAIWEAADHVVGGAGLLLREGRPVEDWTPERLAEDFVIERHPRTLIGLGYDGMIWLVVVDGRDPRRSLGMTLSELQDLAVRLGLRDALNLDGGGSTTMVVQGRLVNRPSDLSGLREVSDALLVHARAAAAMVSRRQ